MRFHPVLYAILIRHGRQAAPRVLGATAGGAMFQAATLALSGNVHLGESLLAGAFAVTLLGLAVRLRPWAFPQPLPGSARVLATLAVGIFAAGNGGQFARAAVDSRDAAEFLAFAVLTVAGAVFTVSLQALVFWLAEGGPVDGELDL